MSLRPCGTSHYMELCFLIFWICSSLFGLSVFLYGFFPMKIINEDFSVQQDIPNKILNRCLENHSLYKRHVGRFVFILIDAFRWDFTELPDHMPYVAHLRRVQKATLLTARCHPPTATMPRIKALMTGSVPNYIDVFLNLGSNIVMEDNLIQQAVTNDLKVVFYGDEVWLDLFPHKFSRMEGTTSFFVSDYTEVDQNVTRHIAQEMLRDDWDVLILHYLGLDHIGHLAGPKSHLVPNKLKEMDYVIKVIHESLQKWDMEHPDNPSFLVVVGDHGMHDSGSHGGATLGEVLASLILIESHSHNTPASKGRLEVSQIDICATLSVLLGLPIPKSSLGVLIPTALKRLTPEQYLFALFYNAQQIANQFLQLDSEGHTKESFMLFLKAQKAHLSWLEHMTDSQKHLVESLYAQASKGMSSHIVKSLVSFDLYFLVIGCSILVQVLCCSLLLWSEENVYFFRVKGKKVLRAYSIGFALFLASLFCVFVFVDSPLTSKLTYFIAVSFALFLILLCSCVLFMLSNILQKIRWCRLPVTSLFLRFGCVLHILSLSASSLIEEEHQTWYFLWCTLMLLVSFLTLKQKQALSIKLKVVGVLLAHRVLRKLNQTGDKWASLPDIIDWFIMPEHRKFMSVVALLGSFGVWSSLHHLKCIASLLDKVLSGLALAFVLLYRTSVGEIFLPFTTEVLSGTWLVRLFWFTWALILLKSLWSLKDQLSAKEVLTPLASAWILASTLLLGPCNIILIPFMVFSSGFINQVFKQPIDKTIGHTWLGSVAFFYHGNSNSLATIDVSVGYIGAEQQDMFSAGVLVLVHTLCFPVLGILLLWLHLADQPDVFQRKREACLCLHTSLILRLLPLSFYSILIAIQREHLFIWSVFAPKLVYEAVHSFVMLIIILGSCCVQLLPLLFQINNF